MNLTVQTVYTKERLLKFSRFHFLSNTKRIVFYSASTLLLFFFAVCASIWDVINQSFQYSPFFVAMLIIILGLDIFNVFVGLILPLFTVEKAKSLNAQLTFTFEDEKLLLESHTDESDSNNEYAYAMFERVSCKNNELYLYFAKNTCYIVDLSSLLVEEKEQIKAKLVENVKKVKWK